jgi:hypothetical protein
MDNSKDIVCSLIDSLNNFSEEDRKLLEKPDLSDKEIREIMSKYDLMKLFR